MAAGPWLRLRAWLYEGQAGPHGAPEFTSSPEGALWEGPLAVSPTVHQGSDRRFCFCENKVQSHVREQLWAYMSGPGPAGMGFYTWAVLLPFP